MIDTKTHYIIVAINAIAQVNETHHPKILVDNICKLKDIHFIITEFEKDKDYSKYVKEAYKQYKIISSEPIRKFQKVYVENPTQLEIESYTISCFEKGFNNFIEYWESVLHSYTRIKAKFERLNYLIDNIELYSNYAKELGNIKVQHLAQKQIDDYKHQIETIKQN